MFDIEFYMKVYDLKKDLMNGVKMDRQEVYERLESYRSPDPVVYNM